MPVPWRRARTATWTRPPGTGSSPPPTCGTAAPAATAAAGTARTWTRPGGSAADLLVSTLSIGEIATIDWVYSTGAGYSRASGVDHHNSASGTRPGTAAREVVRHAPDHPHDPVRGMVLEPGVAGGAPGLPGRRRPAAAAVGAGRAHPGPGRG